MNRRFQSVRTKSVVKDTKFLEAETQRIFNHLLEKESVLQLDALRTTTDAEAFGTKAKLLEVRAALIWIAHECGVES